MTDHIHELTRMVRMAESTSSPLTRGVAVKLVNAAAQVLTREDAAANVERLLDCAERLENLEFHDAAARIFRLVFGAIADDPAKGVEVLNHRALLAVSRGMLAEAVELLEDAHIDAGLNRPDMLDILRSNLATALLLAGKPAAARKWADTTTQAAGANPAVDSLVASVRASIAGLSLNHEEFARAAEAQRRALETGLATANQNDPAVLAAFMSVVSTQFQLAMAEGSQERAQAAVDLMEIALQRTAASLGREDPRTVIALSNFASAQFELACTTAKPGTVQRALNHLRTASDHSTKVLGAHHPQALAALSNLGSALFEAARISKSPALAYNALTDLRRIAALTQAELGTDHLQSVTVLSNLASAEFDLARVDGSRESAERALESLHAASTKSAAVLGDSHPTTLVLEQELLICQAWVSDSDEDGGDGALLTKRRTTAREAFSEEYLSIGDAGKVLQQSSEHCTIVAAGIVDVGQRASHNISRVRLRHGMYKALQAAFDDAGIPWSACEHEDRGDGILVFVPAYVPKGLLADHLPGALLEACARHNYPLPPRDHLRLRLALHAGEIHYDHHGVTGSALRHTFRLLDADVLKSALAKSSAILAVICSAWFFDEVIRHSELSQARAYRQAEVSLLKKEGSTNAWIRLLRPPITLRRSAGQP